MNAFSSNYTPVIKTEEVKASKSPKAKQRLRQRHRRRTHGPPCTTPAGHSENHEPPAFNHVRRLK